MSQFISDSSPVTALDGPCPPAGTRLRSVEAGYPLDWTRIADHLAEAGLHVDSTFTPRQFAGGLANLNYLLRVDGDWLVLRRPPPGELPPGAHDMVREHRILSRLWRTLPLAPRGVHLCNDPAIAGAPFQLMEFKEGVVITGDDLVARPSDPATARKLGNMLVDTLAAIHAVDPGEVGLADLGKPEGFLARSVKGWATRAEIAAATSPVAVGTLVHWLGARIPDTSPAPTLLHNDFKLDNLILDPDTLAPVAVLDWDMGTRGDPLFDLASLLSYWSEDGDPVRERHHSQIPCTEGFPTREEAAFAYERRTGRSLGNFQFYRVLTVFKIGVVFHQLHERHVAGSATDSRYANFGKLGDELFDFALAIADGKYF